MKADKYGPQKRYIAKTCKQITFRTNRNTDKDIIDHLEKVDNVQGYMKSLIRADIQRGRG